MFKNENITAFDINPLIVNEKGAYALDVRIKAGKKTKKLFIQKYIQFFKMKTWQFLRQPTKKKK